MSYSKFGGVYIDGFLDGLFAYILDASILNSGWHTGSEYTTQVCQSHFGQNMGNSLGDGPFAIDVNTVSSYTRYLVGSIVE